MKKKIFALLSIAMFGVLPLMASVTTLNEQNFSNTISKGTVVVDFYADWCGPCKRMAPTFDKLSNQMQNVKFAKVNIDQSSSLAKKYNVSGIPVLILFRDGKEVKRNVGAMDEAAMRRFLQQ